MLNIMRKYIADIIDVNVVVLLSIKEYLLENNGTEEKHICNRSENILINGISSRSKGIVSANSIANGKVGSTT